MQPVQTTQDQVQLYIRACKIRAHVTQILRARIDKKDSRGQWRLKRGVKVKQNRRLAEKVSLRPGGSEGNGATGSDVT